MVFGPAQKNWTTIPVAKYKFRYLLSTHENRIVWWRPRLAEKRYRQDAIQCSDGYDRENLPDNKHKGDSLMFGKSMCIQNRDRIFRQLLLLTQRWESQRRQGYWYPTCLSVFESNST